MPKTIGNPLSWAFGAVRSSATYAADVAGAMEATDTTPPQIRTLTFDDLRMALRQGFDDMSVFRSDVIFICLLYPLMGMALVGLALQGDYIQLLFPVISTLAMLLVIATFAVPVFALNLFADGEPDALAFVIGFLFYVTQ